MDRRTYTDASTEVNSYAGALEFIGEVRGGITYERLCLYAIRYSAAIIDMMQGADEAMRFLREKNIDRSYVVEQVKEIFYRLHFNRLNDYYVTLLLPHTASDQEIHRRWKDLMLIYHPDRKAFPVEYATACTVRLNEAYAALKDPLRRSSYDRALLKPLKRRPAKTAMRPIRTKTKPSSPLFSSIRVKASKMVIPATIIMAVTILGLLYYENQGKNPDLYQWNGVPSETTPGKGHVGIVNAQSEVADREMPTALKPDRQQAIEGGEAHRERMTSELPNKSSNPALPTRQIQPTKSLPSIAMKSGNREIGAPPSQGIQSAPAVTAKASAAPAGQQVSEAEKITAAPNRMKTARRDADLEEEVHSFLHFFTIAYDEGDLDGYLSFYSTSAVENNRLGYSQIRESYRKELDNNRFIYTINDPITQAKGETVLVNATYSIKRLTGTGAGMVLRGNIRLTLIREKGDLKILRNDYDLQ